MNDEITLIRKASEISFWEHLIYSGDSIVSLLPFLKKKKFDKITLTENSISFVLRNKLTFHRVYVSIQSISYNGIRDTLDVKADGKKFSVSVKAFRISYDEANVLRRKLSTFNEQLKTNYL